MHIRFEDDARQDLRDIKEYLHPKNPAHQRQLLSDPSRLPYTTDIAVGDFRFELNVSGVFDASGEYVGNALEWADVTADRLNAGMLGAIDKSQAIIEYKLAAIDDDLGTSLS